VLIVKWVIWAVSLGSGTSGGVLAPLLMMSGALGGLEGMFPPSEGLGFWPLVSILLRAADCRMAEKGITRMPVVERGTRKFLG
jgi:H+/Cl- antiporter ClcA